MEHHRIREMPQLKKQKMNMHRQKSLTLKVQMTMMEGSPNKKVSGGKDDISRSRRSWKNILSREQNMISVEIEKDLEDFEKDLLSNEDVDDDSPKNNSSEEQDPQPEINEEDEPSSG